MSLSPGARLGPYELLGPLGAGGMGEVYRARDSRLGREVAIKVLPSEVASDPSRLKRFEKESRAASALNHPNIVTIYEVGTSDAISWIAMERVEGKTLRELLLSGPLPIKRLLQVAAQIADGLAQAHEAGIVHRDLKPENLMVTKDGLVKILDFGLAKQTAVGSGNDEGSHIPTETETSPGVVLGTVGYMSPEQAAGKPVDFRSDQFAFGSVLYEMTTGERAFQRKTGVDTLAAILNEDPPPIATVNREIPPPLGWIAERCLAKDPEGRYASTKDLAREIATVRDHLSDAVLSGEMRPRRRPLLRLLILATALAAIAAGFFGGARFERSTRSPWPRFQQLTFQHGAIQSARFGPDAQTVLYGLTRGSAPYELFTTRIGSPEYRLMGLPPADILSVSSTSELALLTGGQRPGTLSRVPLAGGAPREVLDSVISAAWSPNGKDLAAVHRVGPRWRLEFPIGKTLYETTSFLFGARFSPKGDLIAAQVVADPSGGVGGGVNVVVVGVDGKRRAELRIPFSGGFVWSRTGEEILLFGGPSRFATEVRAVTLKGRERLLGRFPGAYLVHDIDADGRLLAERVSETLSMVGLGSGQSSERDLTWLDRSSPADVSVDGKSVLFGEGGSVYLRGMDGSPAKRLGDGLPRALSPDGQWALVFREGSPMQAFLLPTGLGEPKKLSIGSIVPYRNSGGSFFADGKRVLIEGAEPGHGYRLYVLDLAGGAPRPVTPEGISLTDGVHTISPDGKFVAAMGPGNRAWIYPIDGASGAEAHPIPGLSPGEGAVRWSSDGRTLFFWGFAVDVASGRRRPWKELRVPDPAVETMMFILPGGDGESYVYGYNRYVSELFLIEGLQ